jgi:hypothetical protein
MLRHRYLYPARLQRSEIVGLLRESPTNRVSRNAVQINAVKLTSGNFGAPGSFGPTALYEFTYVAKDPVVASLGLAAIRDIATYLRNAETVSPGQSRSTHHGRPQGVFGRG